MNLHQYLQRHKHQLSLNIVGPMAGLYSKFHDPTIFVDGGARHRTQAEGFVVGDGDSATSEMDELLNPHKDVSDFGYVLGQVAENFESVFLFGLLGGRRDHEWFNFGETHGFLKTRRRPCRFNFEDQIFAVSAGSWTMNIVGLFSIGVLAPTTIQMTGDCEYPVASQTTFQPLSSLGLSNVGHGKISLHCDGPVFILQSQDDTRILVDYDDKAAAHQPIS